MRHLPLSRILAVALSSAMLALPLGLQAQSLADFHDMTAEQKRAYWDGMSEQERAAKRDEWRSERDAMGAEERAAMHAERMARREEMRTRWNAMSEEEKQAKRETMRAHREERRAMWESMSPEERAAMRERRSEHHRGRQRKD